MTAKRAPRRRLTVDHGERADGAIALRFGDGEDDVMHVSLVPAGIMVRGVAGGLAVVPECTNSVRVIRVEDLSGKPWPGEGQ